MPLDLLLDWYLPIFPGIGVFDVAAVYLYLPAFPGVGIFVVGALSDVYLYLQVLMCLMWDLSRTLMLALIYGLVPYEKNGTDTYLKPSCTWPPTGRCGSLVSPGSLTPVSLGGEVCACVRVCLSGCMRVYIYVIIYITQFYC